MYIRRMFILLYKNPNGSFFHKLNINHRTEKHLFVWEWCIWFPFKNFSHQWILPILKKEKKFLFSWHGVRGKFSLSTLNLLNFFLNLLETLLTFLPLIHIRITTTNSSDDRKSFTNNRIEHAIYEHEIIIWSQ